MFVVLSSISLVAAVAIALLGALYLLGQMRFWQIQLVDGILCGFLLAVVLFEFRMRGALSAACGDDERAYRAPNPEMMLPPIPQVYGRARAESDEF